MSLDVNHFPSNGGKANGLIFISEDVVLSESAAFWHETLSIRLCSGTLLVRESQKYVYRVLIYHLHKHILFIEEYFDTTYRGPAIMIMFCS